MHNVLVLRNLLRSSDFAQADAQNTALNLLLKIKPPQCSLNFQWAEL